MVLDEPTEASSLIIKDIGRVSGCLRSMGDMAIVLVEQYLDFACELGDNFAVMDRGAVKYACDRANLDPGRDQPPDGAVTWLCDATVPDRAAGGRMRDRYHAARASAIFAANRAQGAVRFGVHLHGRRHPPRRLA